MIRTASAIAVFWAAAAGQDEDVYRTLSAGDRVQVTFRNGNTIIGNLVALPVQGAAAGRSPERPAAPPFRLLAFLSKKDPASQTQEAFLEKWMGRHPQGRLEMPHEESRKDLWKAHSIKETPALVFLDAASGTTLKLSGLQTESDLSEALLRFNVAVSAASPQVDYTREKALTLDLSWEYPHLNGTITIYKEQIKKVQKLRPLDQKTLDRIREEKEKIAQYLAQQEKERQEREEQYADEARRIAKEREAEEGRRTVEDEAQRIVREAEELKEALEMYRRFPPPEWGKEKYQDIQRRAGLRLPLTLEEREFMNGYDKWLAAKAYYEKKEGRKAEDQAREESVAPAPPVPEEKGPVPAPPKTEEKPPEEKSP